MPPLQYHCTHPSKALPLTGISKKEAVTHGELEKGVSSPSTLRSKQYRHIMPPTEIILAPEVVNLLHRVQSHFPFFVRSSLMDLGLNKPYKPMKPYKPLTVHCPTFKPLPKPENSHLSPTLPHPAQGHLPTFPKSVLPACSSAGESC